MLGCGFLPILEHMEYKAVKLMSEVRTVGRVSWSRPGAFRWVKTAEVITVRATGSGGMAGESVKQDNLKYTKKTENQICHNLGLSE